MADGVSTASFSLPFAVLLLTVRILCLSPVSNSTVNLLRFARWSPIPAERTRFGRRHVEFSSMRTPGCASNLRSTQGILYLQDLGVQG